MADTNAAEATSIPLAPIPLTAEPEAAEGPRTKRKYTKRAAQSDTAPKRRGRPPGSKNKQKTTTAVKAPKAPKAPKAEKPMKAAKVKKVREVKEKRIAGTKAQGQVAKPVFKFLKGLAKEQGVPVARLVSEAVTSFATRRGLKIDA